MFFLSGVPNKIDISEVTQLLRKCDRMHHNVYPCSLKMIKKSVLHFTWDLSQASSFSSIQIW